MGIEMVKDPLALKEELLRFVFDVYRSTNGAYPALEWVEEKPSPDDLWRSSTTSRARKSTGFQMS